MIGVCLKCPHVQQPPYAGSCRCTIDDKEIIDHVAAEYCPHPDGPRFGTAAMPVDFLSLPIITPGVPVPVVPLSEDAQTIIEAEARLGDELEKLLKVLGADRAAKAFEELTGWDCGCEERKRLLNKIPGIVSMWGWVMDKFTAPEQP